MYDQDSGSNMNQNWQAGKKHTYHSWLITHRMEGEERREESEKKCERKWIR